MRGKKYNTGGVGRGNYGTQTPGARAGDAMEQVIKDMGKKGEEGHRPPLSLNQKIKIKASTLPNRENNVFTAVATGKKVKPTSYNMGGTMKNYQDGGGATSANSISNRDKKFLDNLIEKTKEGKSISDSDKKFLNNLFDTSPKTFSRNSISNSDKKFLKDALKGEDRNMGGTMDYNMGGTMKNYRDGGIEAADKEGSRLSISMERQEDAGYSPSEADFDQQNRLAAEGIMEVGAEVKTIQGHNSRASLGETEGVRGTGAMVRGTKFVGVL